MQAFAANQVLWSPMIAPIKHNMRLKIVNVTLRYVYTQCSQSWSSMRSMKAEKAANVTQPAHIAFGPPLLANTPPAVHPAYNAL